MSAGYSFDGTNDNISFGSDASIDNHSLKTMCLWVNHVALNATQDIITKSDGGATPTGWQTSVIHTTGVSTGHIQFTQDFTVTDGIWVTDNNSIPKFADHHLAVTYDRSSTAQNPVFYIDNVSAPWTQTTAPVGSSNGDAAQNLKLGEDDGGNNDYNGDLAFFCYDNTIFTAADVNRHKWWGVAPGGPSTVDVWHPMWTNDLNNKGTATANSTVTGARLTDSPDRLVKVERMYGSMMGCGR